MISADVLDVFIDDGPCALVFGELPLQPSHHLFIVVPQICLENTKEADESLEAESIENSVFGMYKTKTSPSRFTYHIKDNKYKTLWLYG